MLWICAINCHISVTLENYDPLNSPGQRSLTIVFGMIRFEAKRKKSLPIVGQTICLRINRMVIFLFFILPIACLHLSLPYCGCMLCVSLKSTVCFFIVHGCRVLILKNIKPSQVVVLFFFSLFFQNEE